MNKTCTKGKRIIIIYKYHSITKFNIYANNGSKVFRHAWSHGESHRITEINYSKHRNSEKKGPREYFCLFPPLLLVFFFLN